VSIPKSLADFISNRVDDVFDEMRSSFLPSKDESKSKILSFGAYSLDKLYEQSARSMGTEPNEKTLSGLTEVASTYLEAAKQRLKAAIMAEVIAEARNKDSGQESADDLKTRLAAAIERAEAEVKRTVDVEAGRAKSVGYTEGIIRSAASLGDEDPTVVWICVHDDKLCDLCKRLHLLPDGLTPRAWKLSQCTHEYGNKDSTRPSMAGLHPHDRCILAYTPKGWGYKPASNDLVFIGGDYDLYDAQQGGG